MFNRHVHAASHQIHQACDATVSSSKRFRRLPVWRLETSGGSKLNLSPENGRLSKGSYPCDEKKNVDDVLSVEDSIRRKHTTLISRHHHSLTSFSFKFEIFACETKWGTYSILNWPRKAADLKTFRVGINTGPTDGSTSVIVQHQIQACDAYKPQPRRQRALSSSSRCLHLETGDVR